MREKLNGLVRPHTNLVQKIVNAHFQSLSYQTSSYQKYSTHSPFLDLFRDIVSRLEEIFLETRRWMLLFIQQEAWHWEYFPRADTEHCSTEVKHNGIDSEIRV